MSKAVIEFHDYWLSHVDGDRLPRRADLDPLIEIPTLVPDVFLVDVLPDSPDFRVRLMGTRVVERLGLETTGKMISEWTRGAYREAILALLRATINHRRPVYSVTNFIHPERAQAVVERLMVPLVNDDGKVVIVATFQLFHQFARAEVLRDVLEKVSLDDMNAQFRTYLC